MAEPDDGEDATGSDGWAVTAEAREAIFRGLLEFAPDAIVIIGDDGRIRLVNSQAEVMFGYERGELLGTISRRISHRGQFFPQILRRQLEELPETRRGEIQARQAVRRLTFAAAYSEAAQVPVEALQVQ